MNLSCLLGRHDRVAVAIWWDGFDYRSECRRCGAPLYKRGNVRWCRVDKAREHQFLEYQARQAANLPSLRGAKAPSEGEGHAARPVALFDGRP